MFGTDDARESRDDDQLESRYADGLKAMIRELKGRYNKVIVLVPPACDPKATTVNKDFLRT